MEPQTGDVGKVPDSTPEYKFAMWGETEDMDVIISPDDTIGDIRCKLAYGLNVAAEEIYLFAYISKN